MIEADRQARPGPYQAHTPWSAWAAIFGGVGIFCLGIVGAFAVGFVHGVSSGGRGLSVDPAHFSIWGAILVSEAAMTLGAVWFASWYGGARWRVLALAFPYPRARVIAWSFFAVMVAAMVVTFLGLQFAPELFRQDRSANTAMLVNSAWPAYAVIAILGAPLAEELLFRGFLQTALARSRIGFLGASLVTTTLWALVHLQYSWLGMGWIFALGLMFCWVLWRTGNLWSTIILHALYNASVVAVIRFGLFE